MESSQADTSNCFFHANFTYSVMIASFTRPPAAAAAAAAAYETLSVYDECCCEWLIALAGGWGCMLMCLLAVQKSVRLLGEAEGIDSL